MAARESAGTSSEIKEDAKGLEEGDFFLPPFYFSNRGE